jgi:hypothetical protein
MHALKKYERTSGFPEGYVKSRIENLQKHVANRPSSGSQRASLETNTQMEASPSTTTQTGIESNLQKHVANGKQTSYYALERLESLAKQFEKVEESLQPHLEDWHRRSQDANELDEEINQNRTSLLKDLERNPSLLKTQELKAFNNILDNIPANQRKASKTIGNYLSGSESIGGGYTSIEQCNNAFEELKRCNDAVKRLKFFLRQNMINEEFDRHYDQLLQWAPLSETVMNRTPYHFRLDLKAIGIERRQNDFELRSKNDIHETERGLASFDGWCKNAFEEQERHLRSYLDTTSEELNSKFEQVSTQLLQDTRQSAGPLIANKLEKFDQKRHAAYEGIRSATNPQDYKRARTSFEEGLESLEELHQWVILDQDRGYVFLH